MEFCDMKKGNFSIDKCLDICINQYYFAYPIIEHRNYTPGG